MNRRFRQLCLVAFIACFLVGNAEAKGAQNPTKAADKFVTATENSGSEAGLDASLRTTAAAMPVNTADGSTIETTASHMLLVDYDTGTVLAEKAADAKMYPSSMTKMMTMYLIFEKLKDGSLELTTPYVVSEKAWRMQGSKMFLPIGSQVAVEDLIRGIAIQSGNDACIAVAEGIAGSEDAFANQMNETAKRLGMVNTHFADSSGWPHPENYTTPRDLEILARSLIRDFPDYYHYFGEREFVYHGIHQLNRNLLLGRGALGVDGLKTGHTEAAGYGITLSAKDAATSRRLTLVLNGLDSEFSRADEGEYLLTWGMRNFKNMALVSSGQPVLQAKVWLGKEKTVPLTVSAPVTITVPAIMKPSELKIIASYNKPIAAPIKAGQEVGKLTVTLPNSATKEVPLVAASDVPRRGFFGRIFGVWASWLGR